MGSDVQTEVALRNETPAAALAATAADDADTQLRTCLSLLSGPAAGLPAVLDISRVDLHPDWGMAATTAALAQASQGPAGGAVRRTRPGPGG